MYIIEQFTNALQALFRFEYTFEFRLFLAYTAVFKRRQFI